MAIGTVKTSTMAEVASATTLAGTAPTGVASGDVAICIYAASATPANTSISASWTACPGVGTSGKIAFSTWTLGAFYQVVSGSIVLPTVTISAANRISVAVYAFSGVDTVTPFDVTGVSATNTTTSVTVPSITPVTTGARILGAASMDASSAASITKPSQMTQLQISAGTGRRLITAYDTADATASTATGTRVWTETGTTNLSIAGLTIALRPAATAALRSGWGILV